MTDLTTTAHLDNDLHELDLAISEADSVAAWESAEALAATIEREWREHARGLIEALAAHRMVDARWRLDVEMVRLRIQLATAVQYAEARALETRDRVELCRHHREVVRHRSPVMDAAFQQWRLEQATE